MSRPKRIVCYAINGSGLGHVTRLLGVARWMRRIVTWLDGKPPEIFFLSSSEAPQLTLAEGFPTFKLPSKTAARGAGMDMVEYRRLAKHFIWNTLGVFRPDLLVVDTFPSGSFDELFQVLDGPFGKALVLREVKPEYAARPTFRAALKLYDRVIVPSDEAAVERMQLPRGLSVKPVGKLVHVDPQELLSRAAGRAELGLGATDRLVYLSAGGGGDVTSADVLQQTCRALVAAQCKVLVGAGPLYRGPRLRGEGILWSTEPRLARLFKACDVAISAAGYNTFHELMLARVPTIFLAQDKVADDQAARVRRAVQAGAGRSASTPEGAAAAAVEFLDDPAATALMADAAAALMPHNNADRCARLLLSQLYPADRLDRAAQALAPDFVHRIEHLVADHSHVYGRLLSTLLPDHLFSSGTAVESALELITPELSPTARAEVEAAVQARRGAGVVGAVHHGLAELVGAATARVAPEQLAGLVDIALRKHPRVQEPTPDSAAWVRALLAALTSLVARGDDIVGLYRYWPRVVDADVATAQALFGRFVESRLGRGEERWDMQRELTALKAVVKKVSTADIEMLIDAGAPS